MFPKKIRDLANPPTLDNTSAIPFVFLYIYRKSGSLERYAERNLYLAVGSSFVGNRDHELSRMLGSFLLLKKGFSTGLPKFRKSVLSFS